MQYNTEKFSLNLLIFFLLLSVGFILHFNFYGSDHDTYSIINTFIVLINEGRYVPSRTFGFPISELIIGSSVYFLGSYFTKYFIYFLFLMSLVFFYHSLNTENRNSINFKLFIALILSNSVLIFDNINITDYPLALFFLSAGFFLYKNKKYYLAIILFGLCIGARLNFLIFIYLFYLFNTRLEISSLINSFKWVFLTSMIGGSFYIPYLISHDFSISLISKTHTLGGLRFETDEQLKFMLFEQSSRFAYKIIKIFGFLPFIIIFISIFYFFIKNKTLDFIKENKFHLGLIFLNLFLFFQLPTKTSIISLVTIFTYLLIIKFFNRRIIYLIIFFNIVNYFLVIDFLKINYRYEDKCLPKQALSANFQLRLNYKDLNYEKYLLESKNNMLCSSQQLPSEYRKDFLNQKKLSKND